MNDKNLVSENDLTDFLNRIQKMQHRNRTTMSDFKPLKVNSEVNDLIVGGVQADKTIKIDASIEHQGTSSPTLVKYNISEPKFDALQTKLPILKQEISLEPVIDPTKIPEKNSILLNDGDKKNLKVKANSTNQWADTQPFINHSTNSNQAIKPESPNLNEWSDTQPFENSDKDIKPKKNIKSFLTSIGHMAINFFEKKKKSDIPINPDTVSQEILKDNQNNLQEFAQKKGVKVIFDKINTLTQSISLSGAERDVLFVQEHFKDALSMIGLTDVNQSIKKTNEEMRISVAKRINTEFQFPLDDEHNLNFSYLSKLDDKSKFEFIGKVLLPKISSLIKENVNLSFHINKLTNNNKELSLLNKFAEFNNFDNIDLVFTLLKESPEILKDKPGYEKIMSHRDDIIEKYDKYNNLNENNMSALKELQQMISDIKSTVSQMKIPAEDKKTLFKNFDEEIALNEVLQKGKKVSSFKVTIGDTLKNIDSIRAGDEQSKGIKIKMS